MQQKQTLPGTALDERWKRYRAEVKNCQHEFSEEAVHDLRVATRRLLAVLEMVRAVEPRPRVKKARRMLKAQLDALDDLRDTQVMLATTSATVTDLPRLQLFQEYLRKREKKLLREARTSIRKLKTAGLKKKLSRCRMALEENFTGRKGTADLLSAVDQAYARARQAYGEIDAADSASIHHLRVRFKKFRYMVEIVHPVMKGYPEMNLKLMHAYQSRMGSVQDAEVFLRTLTEFTARAVELAETLRFFEQHRLDMIEGFMRQRDELDTFWRSAPDSRFAWELNHEPVHRSTRHRRGSGDRRVRGRQPASTDGQGPEENGEDRPRPEEPGNGA